MKHPLLSQRLSRRRAHAAGVAASNPSHAISRGWLVSPVFDLLLIANLGWLLFLAPGFFPSSGPAHIEFWQIYFLTTPHRWITLILVATDPDRRGERTWLFVTIALAALVVIAGRVSVDRHVLVPGDDRLRLELLALRAQHGGVFRMYSRKAGGGRPRLETWGMRLFVFYTALRLAGWTTGWMEGYPNIAAAVPWLDLVVLAMPIGLLLLELYHWSAERLGKVVYLASVGLLYGSLLVNLQHGNRVAVLALTMAAAVFHAVEYLAVVTRYADGRKTQGSPSLFQRISRGWPLFLGCYVVGWGLCGYLIDHGGAELRQFWLGINLWAAALHYAFDGLIWKLRRPQTAKVLGVELPSQVAPSQA